jgi:hypothetical protein
MERLLPACTPRPVTASPDPRQRPAYGPSVTRAATSQRRLRQVARRMASIHDGILGQSIPREVMDFYKAAKGGDKFRPRMTKDVVLGIEEALLAGTEDRSAVAALVRARVEASVTKLSRRRLDQWLMAGLGRERLLPCTEMDQRDRLRKGYVKEAMEIFEYAFDYIEALARARPQPVWLP